MTVMLCFEVPAWRLFGRDGREELSSRLRAITRRLVEPVSLLDGQLPGDADLLIVNPKFYICDVTLLQLLTRGDCVLYLQEPSGRRRVCASRLRPSSPNADIQQELARTSFAPDDELFERSGIEFLSISSVRPIWNYLTQRLDVPLIIEMDEPAGLELERQLFERTYRSISDVVTMFVWKHPAFIMCRWLARWKVRPNQVTVVAALLSIATAVLFFVGQFGTGLICAWLMSFLDTVDGKLSRLTSRQSKFGEDFDHGMDEAQPYLWWPALWCGLTLNDAGSQWLDAALLFMMAGTVLIYLAQTLFYAAAGFHIHEWRNFDRLFRLVSARRNTLLCLLTIGASVGQFAAAFVICGCFTLLCGIMSAQRLGAVSRLTPDAPPP